MATTLDLNQAQVLIGWRYTNSHTVASPVQNGSISYNFGALAGTGAGKANAIYQSQFTVSPSATTTIDLTWVTGSPAGDIYGNTIAFSGIKAMYIEHLDDTAASAVTVGGNANAFAAWVGHQSDKVKVKNGACLFLGNPNAEGYFVGTHLTGQLDITNLDASNTATVKLVLIGQFSALQGYLDFSTPVTALNAALL